MSADPTSTPIDLTRCPDCQGPVFYERQGTGLFKFHILPGRREPEFLCPEPVRVVTPT